MAGSTNCVPIINGYLNADNDFMDDLHADGAVAGFFCYPLDTLREEEGSQKIFDFRDKLEEVFTTDEGSEVLDVYKRQGMVTADDDNAYFRCLSCGHQEARDRMIYRYDVHNQPGRECFPPLIFMP